MENTLLPTITIIVAFFVLLGTTIALHISAMRRMDQRFDTVDRRFERLEDRVNGVADDVSLIKGYHGIGITSHAHPDDSGDRAAD